MPAQNSHNVQSINVKNPTDHCSAKFCEWNQDISIQESTWSGISSEGRKLHADFTHVQVGCMSSLQEPMESCFIHCCDIDN